ncbi:MAG: hypothetical protein ABI688_10345, partial [Bacteroidota bacterium]
MKDKNAKEPYLTYFFLVIGFGFLLYTLLLSLVNGVHIMLFLSIGLVAIGIGLIISAAGILLHKPRRKNKDNP